MFVRIYTDGAARGNPDGPGGYGSVLHYVDTKGVLHEREYSQGYVRTTNNRMELLAVIVGLEALKLPGQKVTVYSDSRYVVDPVEKHWLLGWEKIGFKNKKNPDLWKRFLAIYRQHDVRLVWIKGHAEIPENERCDQLAVQASKSSDLLIDLYYESQQDNNLKIFT